MPCTVIVCGFFGDTGKGKIISYLALKDKIAITARAGVGPNAGHTVVYKGIEYKLRMLPSAFVYDKCRLLIGPGVLVNPQVLLKEIELTKSKERVGVDPQCAIIEQKHIEALNALRDETTKVKMVDNLILQDNKIQVAVAENLEHAFDNEFMKFYNSLY